ncbi:NADH oxidase [Apodospora peruviana]|uniref:NADH oxidase n=1 Tax=Apodospora peruviana TaxID=516989 RepID=A0AAE0LZ21_9PEZI|nr:NADH oxidase [Apodospora peruviana]
MASRYSCREGIDPSPLAEPLPFAFSGRTAPNRILKAAMTERLASWSPTDKSARGIPGEELCTLYRTWGAGGSGIIITGNIVVDHDHIEAPRNMIITMDTPPSGAHFQGFRKLAASAKEHGSLMIGQINHPGRQCVSSIQSNPVSASDVQLQYTMLGESFSKPHPASRDEIRAITDAFVHVAIFLDRAGWDGVQLHAAHGYLLAQFLSQTTNLRTDEYGGSLENRARLITEIADEIRAQTRPDFVLSIKINSVEFQANGFSPEEAARLCELLEAHGFDFVELSGGTFEEMGVLHRRESTRAREAFFLEFAEKIVPHLTKTRAIVTGGLRSVGAMLDALQAVDGIGLGRPACTEPFLAKDILSGMVESCIKPLVDDNDFGVTSSIASVQMHMMAKGLPPLDPSDEDVVKLFKEGLAAWFKTRTGKTGPTLFDHLPIDRLAQSSSSGREVHVAQV